VVRSLFGKVARRPEDEERAY